LVSKRLELCKEAVHKLARVALLYDPANLNAARELKEDLPAPARALKLTIQPWEVRDADGFERVFDTLSKKRPDGLYVLSSGPLMFANVKRIAGCVEKPVTVHVLQKRSCGGRRADVLWRNPGGTLSARRRLRGQRF
jgi:hypothetical protein